MAQLSGDLVRYHHQAGHQGRNIQIRCQLINTYLTQWNHDSKPFTWTATPNDIITKVRLIHQDFNNLLDNNDNPK